MKASVIYSTIAKSAAFAAIAVTALVGATSAHARPHFIQDVQYVQVSPQVVISAPQIVITPPQLQVQAPVYVQPGYATPAYVRPVVVQRFVNHGPRFVPGRIYYINGRPFLNGHPYRGHGKKRGHNKHFEHGRGHGYGYGYGNGHDSHR